MCALSTLPVRHKVYAYILRFIDPRFELLVFKHLDFPEAGIQVPGGTVESGENIERAVQRESAEETGLDCLTFVAALGSVRWDMRSFGLREVHHRHYFHLSCPSGVKDRWVAYEDTPSDGSIGPIAFGFYWVDVDAVPALMGGLDEMLPVLKSLAPLDRG